VVNPISERSGLLSIVKGVQGRSAGEKLASCAARLPRSGPPLERGVAVAG
jgi:hypothetical protein